MCPAPFTGKGNTYEIVSKLIPGKQQGRRVLGFYARFFESEVRSVVRSGVRLQNKDIGRETNKSFPEKHPDPRGSDLFGVMVLKQKVVRWVYRKVGCWVTVIKKHLFRDASIAYIDGGLGITSLAFSTIFSSQFMASRRSSFILFANSTSLTMPLLNITWWSAEKH